MTTLLLVHSPLVGPSSWGPLADVASQRGVDVVRPDLTGVADAPTPQWRHLVEGAVEAATGRPDVVVVGHSGAGAVLPVIAHDLAERLRSLVFVDAIIPPAEGEQVASRGFIDFVDSKTVDGRLPKWLDWWPTHVVDDLVPSIDQQRELRTDMPQLSRSFYDEPVPMPSGWTRWPSCYLRLSRAYDAEHRQAVELGWPTSAIDGTHLSIFTDPDGVLDAIERLLRDVEVPL